MKFIKKFVRDNKAATAIEYGLIAALISVAIVAVLPAVGTSLTQTFTDIQNALDGTP